MSRTANAQGSMEQYRLLAEQTGLSISTVRAKTKAGQPLTKKRTGPQKQVHMASLGLRLERRCLCCRTMFQSWGPANRRCPRCEVHLDAIRPADRLWIYAP
jgi:uncharacterized paraquat-inducible protein A